MNQLRLTYGPWEVECLAEDGARLSVLRFDGTDLLTSAPADFRAPAADHGQYETRPVYGYDDCFPSVAACAYPRGDRVAVPDHGELCWLPWKVGCSADGLECVVRSKLLPIEFKRSLTFAGASLTWEFEVINETREAVVFQHVMHALMPLGAVTGLELPRFSSVTETLHNEVLPADVADYLMGLPTGQARMVHLQGMNEGKSNIVLRSGIQVAVTFPSSLFPTLGIWWNNGGYPDEEGCRRVECAVEPIPGPLGSLAEAYESGTHLTVPPNDRLEWTIGWTVS